MGGCCNYGRQCSVDVDVVVPSPIIEQGPFLRCSNMRWRAERRPVASESVLKTAKRRATACASGSRRDGPWVKVMWAFAGVVMKALLSMRVNSTVDTT